jgi:hypothetical protein
MSQLTPSEILNNRLLATIERQRRIICNLLIKNEGLRTRLMHTEKVTDEPQGRESMRLRLGRGAQTAQFGGMRIRGGNDLQVTHTAP